MKVVGLLLLIVSALCESVWNFFLAKSKGITDWGINVIGIAFLIAAIVAFKKSLNDIPLSIAAVIWSGLSLPLTILIDISFFKTKIDIRTTICMVICILSIIALNYFGTSKTNG